MRLSSGELMRRADAQAIGGGIPSHVLMENAAGHLARAALELMGERRSAAVFCGAGNNGGDGVAAAAILKSAGADVRVFLVGDRAKMTPDTARMEQWLLREGGALESFDDAGEDLSGYLRRAGVIVDAIFGIGLRRDVAGSAARAVALINAAGTRVLSADIPSGVSADSGAVLGTAVRADKTVTFSMAKPGHFLEPGCVYCGQVEVCDIGIPAEILSDAFCGVTAVRAGETVLPRRDPLSHKGDHGRLLVVGGCVGYTGAPNLTARAAVRAGAGLVKLGVPRDIWGVCAVKNEEAMPFPLPCDDAGRLNLDALPALRELWAGCDVLAMGPGLGRSEELAALTAAVVREFPGRLVLDADALWAAAQHPGMLRQAADAPVITPHMGEFRRLGGDRTGDRLRDALAFSKANGCVTVLKGHHTLAAFPGGESCVIDAGNPGMARGGSGDVLTGILAAMLGQLSAPEAVKAACWLHAAAGDACAAEKGEYGMTPSDIIEALPYVMKEITE